jgi:hypothetical protein
LLKFKLHSFYYACIVPNAPPKGVNVSRTSATVRVVSWIPLSNSEARGFISHYTVTCFPIAKNLQALNTTIQTVIGMDTDTTRIEGLDANTDYIVIVSATNGAGTSNFSAPYLSSSDNGSKRTLTFRT